jgi:fructokinase
VDLGGTKIEAIALDGKGAELARERVPTPRYDYVRTLETIVGLVRSLEAQLAVEALVGVGMPGTLSPKTGLVKNSNSTWCTGKPLELDLSRLLGRDVRTANDANCFTVSEAIDGAGAGATVVFGVIIGTGVGGSIVLNGQPLTGSHAIAGEWGHNPLPWPNADELPGSKCYCNKLGCIETWLSGPGFAADVERITGRELTSVEVLEAAATGDAACEAGWQRYCDRMARALSGVINLLDPDVIVFGGGMSNCERLYTDVPPLLDNYVFSDGCETPLRKARHGDSSGVRGAAWL